MTYSKLVASERLRRRRWLRTLRAVWHDTAALLREFKWPLLAILIFVFFGGWLYGELMVLAGMDRLPYIDLPYVMLALMVLETPIDIPREWYLVIFWYIQPAVGIYIIGRGAVDFVRLFFNRAERQSAWELAVVSTFRNHVIIIGIGHVGVRIARTLVSMGFDVVAVDNNIESESQAALSATEIPLIAGDARQESTLNDAGVKHARSLIVCTSSDHANLEITMRARDANPSLPIVTRMWDDAFAQQVQRFLNVEVLSASNLAAPAFAGSAVGIEITQTINIDGEEFSMIRLQVAEGSFMDGKTIDDLQDYEDIDIVLHGTNGDNLQVHPPGSVVVEAGDTLVLFASHSKITEIVQRNRPTKK